MNDISINKMQLMRGDFKILVGMDHMPSFSGLHFMMHMTITT